MKCFARQFVSKRGVALAALWLMLLPIAAAGQDVYRIGDTLPKTISLPDAPTLVCFATESSCTIAQESITNMVSWVESRCGSSRLVLASSDQASADRLATQYNWTFPIDVDKTGAMHTGFGVSRSRYFYLVDQNNIVRAQGPIGSASYDFMTAVDVLDSICEKQEATQGRVLSITKRVVLQDGERRVDPTLQRQMVVFNGGASIVIGLLDVQRLLVYNDVFHCESSFAIADVFSSEQSMGLLASQSINSTTATVVAFAPKGTICRAVKIDGTGSVVQIDTVSDGNSTYRFGPFPHRLPDGRLIGEAKGSGDINQPLLVVDCVSDQQNLAGRHTYPHTEYDLSGYTFQYASDDGAGGFYALVALSDTILHFSKDLKPLADIPVHFDTTLWRTEWKKELASEDRTVEVSKQQAMHGKISSLNGLFYDVGLNELWVCYVNSEGYGSRYEFYVSGPVGTVGQQDYLIPDGAVPSAVHNGIVYCTRVGEEGLELVLCTRPE